MYRTSCLAIDDEKEFAQAQSFDLSRYHICVSSRMSTGKVCENPLEHVISTSHRSYLCTAHSVDKQTCSSMMRFLFESTGEGERATNTIFQTVISPATTKFPTSVVSSPLLKNEIHNFREIDRKRKPRAVILNRLQSARPLTSFFANGTLTTPQKLYPFPFPLVTVFKGLFSLCHFRPVTGETKRSFEKTPQRPWRC